MRLVVLPRWLSDRQHVSVLAMSGIHHGPYPDLLSDMTAATKELFTFSHAGTDVSRRYLNTVRALLERGVKIIAVASFMDQVSISYLTLRSFRSCFWLYPSDSGCSAVLGDAARHGRSPEPGAWLLCGLGLCPRHVQCARPCARTGRCGGCCCGCNFGDCFRRRWRCCVGSCWVFGRCRCAFRSCAGSCCRCEACAGSGSCNRSSGSCFCRGACRGACTSRCSDQLGCRFVRCRFAASC